MRQQLREIIVVTRGPSAWQELLQTEVNIRKKDNKQFMTNKNEENKFWNGLQLLQVYF